MNFSEILCEVTWVNTWKKLLLAPKMAHFNPDLAQKLICIVLEIHSNNFLEIFHDHKSLEVNQSNNNKYFNKKNSNYPPKLGILPSNSSS